MLYILFHAFYLVCYFSKLCLGYSWILIFFYEEFLNRLGAKLALETHFFSQLDAKTKQNMEYDDYTFSNIFSVGCLLSIFICTTRCFDEAVPNIFITMMLIQPQSIGLWVCQSVCLHNHHPCIQFPHIPCIPFLKYHLPSKHSVHIGTLNANSLWLFYITVGIPH